MITYRVIRILITSLNISKKLIIRLFFLIAVFSLAGFAPKTVDMPIQKLVAALQHRTDTIPQEKIYIHLDKPYYALGDTIWFKGYLTIGSRHQLSALSGAVYVDLITDQDSMIRTLKLPVTSGMIMGDFVLGDDLREGNYRIRAYTRWMRNAGEECFYDHTFAVGSILPDDVITKVSYRYKATDGRPLLTALVNYTDNEGRALGERSVRYQIVINKKVLWSKNDKTDALGSLNIDIKNDDNLDLNGAYLRTVINSNGKDPVVRNFPIKAALSQTDLQFFPEGGDLINGITSRVAFKAIGIDGLGMAVKGNIVDNNGKAITSILTLHSGMGSFNMRPEKGNSYTANVTFTDGSVKTVALPKAADHGYVLNVYQPVKDSILLRVQATALLQQSTVNIVAQVGGESFFSSAVTLKGAVTNVWINKSNIPTGIVQFTLFNSAGEPLNERLAFVRNADQMKLDIKTAKQGYKSKEPIQIDLRARDSKGNNVAGNFSVSVTDESKLPFDEAAESTILSNLLLTSDLKGYVEKPNYYFINVDEDVNRALDNLMLTQGYRRFTWKNHNTISTKPTFIAEGLGFEVAGVVQSLNKKTLPNAKVHLLALKAGLMKATTTDSAGRFKFDGIFLTDSIKFTVQARDANGGDKVKVIIDTLPRIGLNKNPNWGDINTNINATLKTYLDNGKKLDDIYEQAGMLDRVQRLKEVRIRAKKLKADDYITPQGMFKIPESSADQVITFADASSCNNLAMCLQARIQGVTLDQTNRGFTILRDIRERETIKLILDGRKINSDDETDEILTGSIMPEDVAKIMVVRTNRAMVNYLGGSYIMILTKLGSSRRQYNPSIVNLSPKGFNRVREFYSPRYERAGVMDRPDLRSTIYWSPYIKTGTNGTTSFNYFNADGPGNYKVVVEGINADGELGRQVYRYKVEAGPSLATTHQQPDKKVTDKGLAAISAPLDSFNTRFPMEKLYVHTDKPYYNLGDTLWFKAYLVDRVNQAPSKISGLLYIDMADDTSTMARRISVPVKNGVAWGQIPLTKAIFHEGGYSLRAYTNWMQNFDADQFFNRRIYVGTPLPNTWLVNSVANVKKVGEQDELTVNIKLNRVDKDFSAVALKKVEVKIFDDWHWIYKENHQTGLDGSLNMTQLLKEKTDVTNMHVQISSLEKGDTKRVIQVPITIVKKIDLQFLPEGGKLVAGLKSTVGFKALSDNGNGTPVSGGIFDSKGKQVTDFTSLYNGMGSFEFTPQPGEKYTARLTKPNLQSFTFPAASAVGIVMHLNNPEHDGNVDIEIAATANSISADSACYLIGTSRGIMYYSKKVEAAQKLLIAKDLFPTGIARFTLFRGKRPLVERIVFIDHHDQLNFTIGTNKNLYNKRDSVSLEIQVKDKNGFPVQGEFSVAVTDDTQVRADTLGNNSITTSLLLNSELKGNIETPGYYIHRKHKDAWQALDNLLLTQGWTGYDWKDIFTHDAPITHKPEKEFKITGLVSNVSKKPLPGVPVIISSQKPNFLATAFTDSAGVYTFKNLPQIDSGSFFIQANNKNGKKMMFGNINVNHFVAPALPVYTAPVMPWYVNTDTTQLNTIQKKLIKDDAASIKMTGIVLKEVKIKERKIIKGDSFNPFGAGDADLVYDDKDIKESAVMDLYEILKLKIPGFKVGLYSRGRRLPMAAMPRIDQYPVRIMIDGRGLPLYIDDPGSVAELVEEMRQIKIVSLVGIEVIQSYPNLQRLKAMHWPAIPHIILTTKNGNGWYRFPKTGTVTYRPLPIMHPQQFYSPKYNVKPLLIEPDYRPTLHWEPNLSTDINGRAKLSFYTSDNNNSYNIKIAGIQNTGGLGDGHFTINNKAHNP